MNRYSLHTIKHFMGLIPVMCVLLLSGIEVQAQSTGGGCEYIHIVQRGENLYRISLRYGLPVSVIAAASGITDTTRIFVGDEICIPPGGTINSNESTFAYGASGPLPQTIPDVPVPDRVTEVPADFVNDPAVNRNANACFEGGAMAGRCVSRWDWECGWHLIRYNHNLITAEEFPSWCAILLPPEIMPETTSMATATATAPDTPSVGCIDVSAGYGAYFDFGGGYFLPAVTTGFTDADCTNPSGGMLNIDVVYAPAGYDPLTLCNLNGTYTVVYHGGNDVYACA